MFKNLFYFIISMDEKWKKSERELVEEGLQKGRWYGKEL